LIASASERNNAGVFLYAFDLIEFKRRGPAPGSEATLASLLARRRLRLNEHMDHDDDRRRHITGNCAPDGKSCISGI
jgi:hypothetical protein